LGNPVVRGDGAGSSDRLHRYVQWVLRVGLFGSVVAMTIGLSIHLASGAEDAPAVRLWALFQHTSDAGLALTAIGILMLALTPVFRVLVLVPLWWRERDYRFVAVALAVLATLALSVVLGKGG
jgi:uncharacterized membrane protein